MSKSDGLKIGIRFTEDLIGDVSGNEEAFTITGKEYQYVNGALVDRNYQIDKVERYPAQRVWGLGDALELDLNSQLGYEDTYDTSTLSGGTHYWMEVTIQAKKTTKIKAIKYKSRSTANHSLSFRDNNDNELAYKEMSGVASGGWYTVEFDNSVNIIQGQIYKIYITRPQTTTYRVQTLYDGIIWKCLGWENNAGSWNETPAIGLIEALEEYISPSMIITEPINKSGEYRLRWLETKPTKTSIIIEYTTGQTQGQWQEVDNGGIVNADTNLWIRATLSTEDTAITPILQDLWLEVASAPQDKILITMDWWGRFNNVEDKIKVLYDASKGSLAGAGGAVESFEIEFTPEDLIQTPNPNAEELIKAYPYEIVADLKEVDIVNVTPEETIKAYPYEIVLNLINVDEINP